MIKEELDRSRRRRVGAAAAATVAALVAFASLGGVGLAHGVLSLAQYQYGKKVTICHKGKHTITISMKAWPAHKKHGDTMGACANGHKKNKGKHKGESHHAPNPATGTGDEGSSSGANTNGPGNGHGNGKGHNK